MARNLEYEAGRCRTIARRNCPTARTIPRLRLSNRISFSENGWAYFSVRVWLGPESNRRHVDFQSTALPTELPSLLTMNNALFNAPSNPIVSLRAIHIISSLPCGVRKRQNASCEVVLSLNDEAYHSLLDLFCCATLILSYRATLSLRRTSKCHQSEHPKTSSYMILP